MTTLSRSNRSPSALGYVGRFGIGEPEGVAVDCLLHRRTAEGRCITNANTNARDFITLAWAVQSDWDGYPSGLSHTRLSIRGWTSETAHFPRVMGHRRTPDPPTCAFSLSPFHVADAERVRRVIDEDMTIEAQRDHGDEVP
jgi:hypothetical protein